MKEKSRISNEVHRRNELDKEKETEKFDLSKKEIWLIEFLQPMFKTIVRTKVNYRKGENREELEKAYPQKDVKEFIRREIERRQIQINILVDENSGESISRAEELEEDLNVFRKDAGDKLI